MKINSLPRTEYINLSIKDGSNYAGRIIVEKGQKVFKNQILTLPDASSSCTPIHSPYDGIVDDIYTENHLHIDNLQTRFIKIRTAETKYQDSQNPNNINLNYQKLITKIRYSGIIGLGGAGFPSFKKILNQKINYLIINAAECEAPIEADAALMSNLENVKKIISGINSLRTILKENCNNLKVIIAIEDNKPDAISNFKRIPLDNDIRIEIIPTAYPNGDAKYLINKLLGLKISKNERSTNHGILCFNVATVFSIHQALNENQPLVKRIVTITGSAIKNPGNYEVNIGTPITEIIKFFDIEQENLTIKMGGHYMGVPVKNINSGILKTTNSLIIDFKKPKSIAEACINCGFCVTACPQKLLPQQLFKFSNNENSETLKNYNISHCIECGLCDTVCPSNIEITKNIQYGKALIKNYELQQLNANNLKSRYENYQSRKARLEQEKLDKSKKQTKINKSDLLKKALARAKQKSINTN